MKINIGTKNPIKVEAVKETIINYDFLKDAKINSLAIDSGVGNQPKSIEETMNGAINRAKNSFKECDLSIGIEDGLMKIPNTKTEYMNVCICVIFDGKENHIGLSSAFEYPKEVTRLVFKEGIDINQAFYKVGLTKNPKIGTSEGAIGILTKGRIPRKEHPKQAISMALIHLENAHLF